MSQAYQIKLDIKDIETVHKYFLDFIHLLIAVKIKMIQNITIHVQLS